MTREGDLTVLKYFLAKLPQHELVESVATMISRLCRTDEELREMVHDIVTLVQAREIMAGRHGLEGYEEPHRSEIEKKIKELKSR